MINDKKLEALAKASVQVDEGKKLKNQLEKLGDVVKFCDAEIGFTQIVAQYNNDGQVDLARLLDSSKEVHEHYRHAIKLATLDLIKKLEEKFNNIEFKGEK